MITHSFVMAVLDSHAMFEKQMRWLSRILPDTWQIVIVDDESHPPLHLSSDWHPNSLIVPSLSKRQPGEWTQKEALNLGFDLAIGDYILKSDVDHIFTPEVIQRAAEFNGDMLLFERRAGRFANGTVEPLEHSVTSPIDDVYLVRKSILEAKGGYPHTRVYGDGGRFLWEFSKAPEAQPQPGAPIFVCPSEFATYHNVERIRGAECDRD